MTRARNVRMNETNKRLRARNRTFVNGVKAQMGCAKCGMRDIRVLDFHHKNPDEKFKAIGSMVATHCSLEKLQREIEKCIVLCANCHRIETYEEAH